MQNERIVGRTRSATSQRLFFMVEILKYACLMLYARKPGFRAFCISIKYFKWFLSNILKKKLSVNLSAKSQSSFRV